MATTITIPLEGVMTFLNSMGLSTQSKKWLGKCLIEQAEKEERIAEGKSTTIRKVSKVRKQAALSPSDVELEARFKGKDMPELPDDPDWHQVIKANTGKTIKPIEKWL